jgi:sugar transferase EpsL
LLKKMKQNAFYASGLTYPALKSVLDRLFGILGLVITAPVMLMVAVLVRWNLGSPVLFRDQRPGYKGCLFTCYKFRTMTDARDESGALLSDDQRLGSFGRLLRRASLDELPQLWNIARGDLSLVGPRPLLKEYLPFYTEEERRRHDVRPGLTGWAQIHGRGHLPFKERISLDVWYVDHMSWSLDMRILLRTVGTVIRGNGTELAPFPSLAMQRQRETNAAGSRPLT